MGKKLRHLFFLGVLVIFLGGCSAKKNDEFNLGEGRESSSKSTVAKDLETKATSVDPEQTTSSEVKQPSVSRAPEVNEPNPLSDYSKEQIEYSRVWLQLMDDIISNEEYIGIETLYVDKISAGSYMDPTDKTSLQYPSDVVRLSGSRKIDGMVTYSSNGDGTITVYDFPYNWDNTVKDYLKSKQISPSDYGTSIMENGHVVEIGVGDNEEIVKIIDVMVMNE